MQLKFFLTFILMSLTFNAKAEENILKVYGWEGSLPSSITKKFEEETGITVKYSTYVNNEVLYAKLKAANDISYDIIMPSSYFIKLMIESNLIQKIDKSKILNFKNINPSFLNKDYDKKNEYTVPYLWGSTGIIINRTFHSEKIEGWKDLWHKRYKNQLFLLDDTRDVFSMALLVLGKSANTREPGEIKAAYHLLQSLIPNVKIFSTEGQKTIYLDEEATLGMGWNGEAFVVKQENPNIDFIYPKEGFIITLDCLAIPINAKHTNNAYKFINFLLKPEIAKETSLISGFATANIEGMKLLPKAIRDNKSIYPDKETMNRGIFQQDVGNEVKTYEEYFEQLKLNR